MSKPQVIIVDDEPQILTLYEHLFSQWYEVIAFSSANELLNSLDTINPSGFILDWLMPEMTGLELCRRLRREPQYAIVPIAFFTGVAPDLDAVKEVFDAGGQLFVSKSGNTSVNVSQIHALIESYIQLQHQIAMSNTMLSILKHDLANSLTGVVTGLEVLGMHEAFQEKELSGQLADVLYWSRHMANLTEDIDEVLGFGKAEKITEAGPVTAAQIFQQIQGYTHLELSSITFTASSETQAWGPLGILARMLYYVIVYLRSVTPQGTPLLVLEFTDPEAVKMAIQVAGNYEETLRFAFLAPLQPDHWATRRSALPIQFVRNALSHLSLQEALEISTKENFTTITLSLPLASED